MKPSIETLMAYVDGELSTAECADVETAMAADRQIAEHIERLRAQRDRLRAAFDDVLSEPVPNRLIQAARNAPTSTAESKVTNIAQARRSRPTSPARRWSWPEWTAMAASLVVGMFISHSIMRSPSDPIATQNGNLVAQGALASALTSQLASETESTSVKIALSYRDRSGNYCRSFVMTDNALAGVACREQQTWRVNALAKTTVPAGETYRMAASALPASILQTIDAQIEGEPLNAAAETQAIRAGWR
jgi:hypothetical protein